MRNKKTKRNDKKTTANEKENKKNKKTEEPRLELRLPAYNVIF